MGSADANWRVELGSPRVGFSCGFYNLDISTFYPPTGLLRRGSTPPPRVNPTRGAPSLIKVPVCRDSGIFSSRGAANGKEQKQARATRPNLVKHRDDQTDHDKYAKEAKCKDMPGCSADSRARNAFNALPNDLGSYGVGPLSAGTSNAVALAILTNAGFSWTPPSCAWGAINPPPLGPNSSW
jgi:hypothetical protein